MGREGGSSPLARGTHQARSTKLLRARLIPARAGNTCLRNLRVQLLQAHPRSRGEHVSGRVHCTEPHGSSPLARGTGFCLRSPNSMNRLIPARAGNTELPFHRRPSSPAHPRSRGEHAPHRRSDPPIRGSSPLARGTLRRLLQFRQSARLIPARAGNTPNPSGDKSLATAHPRSRGEHTC